MAREKKTTIKAPCELIIAICDKELGDDLERYINSQGITSGILMNGKGPAESMVADLFGFGMNNKDILMCIVPIDRTDKIVAGINAITGIEDDKYGLTMVLPMSGADSNLLDLVGVLL